MRAALVVGAFLTVAPIAAHAALTASTEVIREPDGSIGDPLGCGLAGDGMRLTVRDNGNKVATLSYCSAYGAGDAKVARDARGKDFVLLEMAEGHGTSATTRYLAVYRFTRDRSLAELLRTEISTPVSPHGAMVTYAYDIQTPKGGGLKIVMRQHIEKNEQDTSLCCIPKDPVKILQVDTPH